MIESAGEVHLVHLIRIVTLVADDPTAVEIRRNRLVASPIEPGVAQRSAQPSPADEPGKLVRQPTGSINDQDQWNPDDPHLLLQAGLGFIGNFTQRSPRRSGDGKHLVAATARRRGEDDQTGSEAGTGDIYRRMSHEEPPRQQTQPG